MAGSIQIRAQQSEGHADILQHSKKTSGFAELKRHTRDLEDQMAGLRRERDALRHAMYEAAQTQRRLCGPRQLHRRGFEIAGEIFPVRDLSGDFISVFELQGDVVFAIGDIAGKGLYAGMWFTHVVNMIRMQMEALGDPAAVLAALNRGFLRIPVEFPLTTVLLAQLDLKTGEITYCNAGHPPALLLRDDGQAEQLREGGPLLGAVPGASFTNGTTRLGSGDALLGYSDGLLECRNGQGAYFDRDRLLTAVRACSGSSASFRLFSVLAAVEDFAGSHPREDDMALLVVQRAVE